MVVVVGLPPRLPLAMRWVGARRPVVDGSLAARCVAAKDAPELW